MSAAAAAFDAVAPEFDARFGAWLSVAAQRAAVREALLHAFPPGAHVLELGGGTGEDAAWLAFRGRRVTLTDASPAMVQVARSKLRAARTATEAHVVAAEALEEWARARSSASAAHGIRPAARGMAPAAQSNASASFDGAFSNFAALNCVADLRPVARGLARLLRPDAPALLVLFGTACPAEVLVQLLRREPRAALRRLSRGEVAARLGGREFGIRYHRAPEIAAAFAPWFRLEQRTGIGVFVPPSAAEPWISRHPRLLAALETMDRAFGRHLAPLGDHVLYQFVRTSSPVSAAEPTAAAAAPTAAMAAREVATC